MNEKIEQKIKIRNIRQNANGSYSVYYRLLKSVDNELEFVAIDQPLYLTKKPRWEVGEEVSVPARSRGSVVKNYKGEIRKDKNGDPVVEVAIVIDTKAIDES